MDVAIVKIETGRVVALVPVNIHGANYTPHEKDYFDEAWRAAVEDGLVDADEHQLHRFELRGPTGV
jgi:hypothetical protein